MKEPGFAGGHRNESELIPATISQRLLSLMVHYRGGNGAMNCPIIYRLHGQPDHSALSAALTAVTSRHESLRTIVSRQAGQLIQHIHPPGTVAVRRVDLRDTCGTEEAAGRALVDELRTEIPVGSWPLRATLFRTGKDDYLLCLVIHHYVTDGWSNAIVREELWELYRQLAGGGAGKLPPVPWQYRDFARWQADREHGAAWRAHESYWRRQLDGVRFPRLPGSAAAAGAGGPGPGFPAGVETFVIPESSVSVLAELAARQRATLFAAMLAVFYLWLYQVTGEADLAVGSMFANRLHPEAVRTVGFFANLLVLRTEVPRAGTFRDLLTASRDTVNGALDHQEVPYQMVRADRSGQRPERPEDLMFQMQPWPVDEHQLLVSAEARQLPPPEGVIARFAFEVFIWPSATGGLLGQIVFTEDRFGRSWVRQAAAEYEALVSRVAAAPMAPLARHS